MPSLPLLLILSTLLLPLLLFAVAIDVLTIYESTTIIAFVIAIDIANAIANAIVAATTDPIAIDSATTNNSHTITADISFATVVNSFEGIVGYLKSRNFNYFLNYIISIDRSIKYHYCS